MVLMHFDAAPPRMMAPKVFMGVKESVTVTALPSQSKTHLLKDSGAWGWSELRDYVVESIETKFGLFPRDAYKEAAIFKRFTAQYGSQAPKIARYAFEVCDGWWCNSPMSVQRFCRGSDPYFGDLILARLRG